MGARRSILSCAGTRSQPRIRRGARRGFFLRPAGAACGRPDRTARGDGRAAFDPHRRSAAPPGTLARPARPVGEAAQPSRIRASHSVPLDRLALRASLLVLPASEAALSAPVSGTGAAAASGAGETEFGQLLSPLLRT